ncbi:MAG TPA: helix-turn-helix transcriptional regulator [Steroidobacteraceae bacterium]|nr:helix-turn-helix transcriptional regulator [Steroidobacteraceae bacterium]
MLSYRGRRLILMQEERPALSTQDLAPLGLARRETETLKWVACGKTDAEIARILSISTRTVNHTLARVYRKLGVEARLAAALRAARVALSVTKARVMARDKDGTTGTAPMPHKSRKNKGM